MQQQGGRSQYGASPFAAATTTSTDPINQQQQQQQQQQQLQLHQQQQRLGDLGAAEEASPISSRPPAGAHLSSAGNFDEHLLVATGSGGLPDDDALGGDEADRGGGSGGNRWPRQETLALLKIRSDMDAIFRDATLKGPLWEDVSRKLAELGYKRSAKKCKEKFENVHKYYKRTKEGRAGRQDGKSYRFFTQLEALHSTIAGSSSSSSAPPPLATTAASPATVQPLPLSMSNIPISSVRVPTPLLVTPSQGLVSHSIGLFNPDLSAAAVLPGTAAAAAAAPPPIGVSFSSDSSSSLSGSDEMDDEDDELDLEPDLMEAEPSNRQDRKRKRGSSSKNSASQKMMEFFEGLMKQVMQKQEALQQRFLEAIEKREQDRMIREEAWKRQEMARLAREHDLMAQERTISASRDAAIIAFLQKITGQTIQWPPAVTVPAAPPPPPPPPQVAVPQPSSQPPPQPPTELFQKLPSQQPPPQQQQQQLHQHQNLQTSVEVTRKHQPTRMSTEIVVAVPEQQVAPQDMSGGGGFEATSSRWPKAEVLALIKLRSGLEPRYQEAGPKGPLWEEISAGMHRMGYKRNPKRCKEKWENINKYFKKVKESNKKRPEDAKTCPYFHELDALYRKKILGGTPSVGGVGSSSHRPEDQLLLQQQQTQQQSVMMDPKLQERTNIPPVIPSTQITEPDTNVPRTNGDLTATLFGEGSDSGAGGVAKKPEDILKEQQHQNRQQLTTNEFYKIEEPDSDINLDQDQEDEYNDDVDDDDDDDDDDGDEEAQEEMKMAYKIQFQRPNAGSSSNGGGNNGTASFLAMVQ